MKKDRKPEAFGIVAQAGTPHDPSKLQEPEFESRIHSRIPIPWYHKCGHRGFIRYNLSIKGARTKANWFESKCPECRIAELEKEFISCALCGLYIAPGDPIALYNASNEYVNPWAQIHIDPNQNRWAIGCMRWDCCPSGGFFAGHWLGIGHGFREYDWEKAKSPE